MASSPTKPTSARKTRKSAVAPDKATGTAKENIAAVFARLGGVAAMAAWAAENQTEFYRFYARLLPLEGDAQERDSLSAALIAAAQAGRLRVAKSRDPGPGTGDPGNGRRRRK